MLPPESVRVAHLIGPVKVKGRDKHQKLEVACQDLEVDCEDRAFSGLVFECASKLSEGVPT